MKTSSFIIALALYMGVDYELRAQSSVGIGQQIEAESDLVDGGKYLIQSQATGTPYIVDAGSYYSMPNAGNSPTTSSVYYLYSNGDGTWRIKNQYTGKFWGVPVMGENLAPVSEPEAGNWSLNFNSGIAYPRALDATGTTLSIDRSSQRMVGWTTKTSSNAAQRIKIFEVDAPLSSEALPELAGFTISVSSEAATDLEEGQWYVMFDRGVTGGTYPHGYLYEDVNSHTLYNSAAAPSGTAIATAPYLVRLSSAGDAKYYVQNGLGNFFGAFTQGQAVPVVATATEPVVIAKIADTDGHFYLQTPSTGIILDANDVRNGTATVVGWGSTVPTSIGNNNDWAFYPVQLEEIGDEVALFADDVTVSQGYQTTGRGNTDALLLRIDVSPSKLLQSATFKFSLDEATRANISALSIYETTSTEFIANIPKTAAGTNADVAETMSVTVENVTAGNHHFWLCATVKEDAALGAILDAALTSIVYFTSDEVELDVAAFGNPNRQGAKVFERQHFAFRPTTDACRYYRIPAMILDAEGNIVIASDKRYNSNSDLGNHKIDVVSKRSEDGGSTWTDLTEVAVGDGNTAAYFGYGDAALARALNGDLVCIMAAGNKMWGSNATDGMKYAGFARSSDNGKRWTLTRNLFASSIFTDENSADGSLSVANIFTSSGKGLTTTDGVMMFTTNCRATGTSSPNLCYVLYSTDNGGSWRLSNALAYSGCDESKLEQLNDGSLLLSVRQSGNRGWNTGSYVKNDDGTVTFNWGTQYRSADLWGNACNADMIYYSRASATEPDIMLHSYINSSGRESLQLAMSLDGGKSWKSVYNIQPNGSCYSTMAVLPDGNVALLFEDESYSAGNGYAINFVTITREQILSWYEALGGHLPDGVAQPASPAKTVHSNGIYNVSGQHMRELRRGINVANGKKFLVR